jgi:iron complex transport system ATP-binding protein
VTALLTASGLRIPGRLQPTALELRAGELTCLIGPNGSGKTSLLHALAGVPPASGTVLIDGENPHRLHPDRRQRLLTLLPAIREVLWPLYARDLLALNLPQGTDWHDAAQALALAPLLDRRVDALSTGERTRVLIARAMAPNPSVMLLDEPTANLDPYWQLFVMERLKAAAADDRKAVLLTMHDLASAQLFADRILVVEDGAIVGDGAPAEVLSSQLVENVFGVEWSGSRWAFTPAAGRQSSP